MCTNQDISNTPFIMRVNRFLVHGHKIDLPHITCIFHLFKYVIFKNNLVSAILHHISLLRLLPNSYFKISTFQHNFLCSSSFNKLLFMYCITICLHRTCFTCVYLGVLFVDIKLSSFKKYLNIDLI